jgi:RNA polymerase sigma-54 factor
MLKQGLFLTQTQKLSPQQIQFIKLLQVPTVDLDARIEEELELNPALEEGKEEPEDSPERDEYEDDEYDYESGQDDDLNINDYLQDEDYAGYKMQGDGPSQDDEQREMPIAMQSSLNDQLLSQLGFLRLTEHEAAIGKQLIGSIDSDGYIRRE